MSILPKDKIDSVRKEVLKKGNLESFDSFLKKNNSRATLDELLFLLDMYKDNECLENIEVVLWRLKDEEGFSENEFKKEAGLLRYLYVKKNNGGVFIEEFEERFGTLSDKQKEVFINNFIDNKIHKCIFIDDFGVDYSIRRMVGHYNESNIKHLRLHILKAFDEKIFMEQSEVKTYVYLIKKLSLDIGCQILKKAIKNMKKVTRAGQYEYTQSIKLLIEEFGTKGDVKNVIAGSSNKYKQNGIGGIIRLRDYDSDIINFFDLPFSQEEDVIKVFLLTMSYPNSILEKDKIDYFFGKVRTLTSDIFYKYVLKSILSQNSTNHRDLKVFKFMRREPTTEEREKFFSKLAMWHVHIPTILEFFSNDISSQEATILINIELNNSPSEKTLEKLIRLRGEGEELKPEEEELYIKYLTSKSIAC